MLEVSSIGADMISEGSNYAAGISLAAGQPQFAAGFFALGRGADIVSLGSKFTLTAINYEKYSSSFGGKIFQTGLNRIGGRLLFGNPGFNNVAKRFTNKNTGRFITNFKGYKDFGGKIILNFGTASIKF